MSHKDPVTNTVVGEDTVKCDAMPDGTPSSTVKESDAVTGGIFFAEADTDIAGRLCGLIREAGCDAELCDFMDGGRFKLEILNEFLSSKDIFFWLATTNSIKNDVFMKAAGYIANHTAIMSGPRKNRFVPLFPKEDPHPKHVPPVFSAITGLREDEWFIRRLEATLLSMKKARGVASVNPMKMVASEPVDGSISEDQRSPTEPTSAKLPESEHRMQAEGQGDCGVSAIQEPRVGAATAQVGSELPTVYHVHVEGSNNLIQIGSGNQIIHTDGEAQQR